MSLLLTSCISSTNVEILFIELQYSIVGQIASGIHRNAVFGEREKTAPKHKWLPQRYVRQQPF
jgi:hypothetical protein